MNASYKIPDNGEKTSVFILRLELASFRKFCKDRSQSRGDGGGQSFDRYLLDVPGFYVCGGAFGPRARARARSES